MNLLGTVLRDQAEEVKITLKSGQIIQGDTLRQSRTISVSRNDKGLFVHNDLAKQFSEWFETVAKQEESES